MSSETKPRILRVDHNDVPYILLFESVSSTKPSNAIDFSKQAIKGLHLYLHKADVNRTRNWNIGVQVYAGWTSLITKNVINTPGMYFISTNEKNGEGFYSIVEKHRGKLLIADTGTAMDIENSAEMSMSQFTLISVESLDGKTSKLRELSNSTESKKSSPIVLVSVLLTIALGTYLFGGSDYLVISKDGFNLQGRSEAQAVYDDYVEAKRLYMQAWPKDIVAVSEFLNILKLGENPSTYNNYVDWGKQVTFSINLDSKTADKYSNITQGVMGDYVLTISNPGYVDLDDMSLGELPVSGNSVEGLNKESIELLKQKTSELKNSVRMAPVAKNWSIIYNAVTGINLQMRYSQDGTENFQFTPKQLVDNDNSGFRQAIVTGDPAKVLTAVAYVQGKAPVTIQSFKISKNDYSDEMSMIIKIRGS